MNYKDLLKKLKSHSPSPTNREWERLSSRLEGETFEYKPRIRRLPLLRIAAVIFFLVAAVVVLRWVEQPEPYPLASLEETELPSGTEYTAYQLSEKFYELNKAYAAFATE